MAVTADLTGALYLGRWEYKKRNMAVKQLVL